jgi:RNA polymerase sigma factor (sigma-70 family)
VAPEDTLTQSFAAFFVEVEPRLRHALAASLGADVGVEAAADALAYGWEHWDRVGRMANPAGYLYRVGRSRGRRLLRIPSELPPVREQSLPWVEVGLPAALESLSERQRVAVVLVHSLGWTQTEVAELLGVSQGAVRTHLERGMKRLRSKLGVSDV